MGAFAPVALTARDGAPLRLEPATDEDALATLVLQRGVLAEGDWFITEPGELAISPTQRALEIRDLARQDNSLFLLARRGASVLGYLTLHGGTLRRMRHTTKLAVLVDARFRGIGVGSALLSAGLDWAVANPAIDKVGLAVYGDNTRAIRLYEALGFVEEGRREREYKLADGSWRGDVLMYRWVGEPVTRLG